MSNIKVFFKNFTAGRKALVKRMGIYLASSLAVFEAANIFLEDGAVVPISSWRTERWRSGAKAFRSAASA